MTLDVEVKIQMWSLLCV